MTLGKPKIKDGKVICPCGEPLIVDALKGSGLRIITRDGTELEITFDRVEIHCAHCDKDSAFESPLLDVALAFGESKDMIRARTNWLPIDKLGFDLPRFRHPEKERFLKTLSKTGSLLVYRIIIQNTETGIEQVLELISKKFNIERDQAYLQFLTIAIFMCKFRIILWAEGAKKLSTDEIIDVYNNPRRLHDLCVRYEKSLGKDRRDLELAKLQKTIYFIPINAWASALKNLRDRKPKR